MERAEVRGTHDVRRARPTSDRMQTEPVTATYETTVFEDDFVLRQIQQIANLVAAIARSPGGVLPEGLLAKIDEAYRDLGLDRDLVDSLDSESLRRTLHDDRELDALIDLLLAHAEASAQSEDLPGATRRMAKAVALMVEGDARADAAHSRLAELRS